MPRQRNPQPSGLGTSRSTLNPTSGTWDRGRPRPHPESEMEATPCSVSDQWFVHLGSRRRLSCHLVILS